MRILGYLLMILGVIALIAVFFGYTHQLLMAFIGIGGGYTILSESRDDVDNGKGAESR